MNITFSTRLIPAAGVLALTLLVLPQMTIAQRFNHGGEAPAARPAMQAPRSFNPPAPRPSAPPAPRPSAPPAPRPEPVRAAPTPNPVTINGGSRNFGNHDFSRAGTVNTNAEPRVNNNDPRVSNNDPRANNNSPRVNNNPRVDNNPRGNTTAHVNANMGVRDRGTVYHTGGYNGLHPYSYHPYHPYYFGPRWHPIGFFLPALASTAIRVSIGSQWYYYDDGCYYEPSPNGYSVVPPPIGAIVSYLPEGYETTMVGNDEFYYYGGAFYISTSQGYQVVAAPLGAVVSELPVGAVDQQIDGQDLLVYNNVYYQPISQDGNDAYEVVAPQ